MAVDTYDIGRNKDEEQGERATADDIAEGADEEQSASVARLHERGHATRLLKRDMKIIGQDQDSTSQQDGSFGLAGEGRDSHSG